MTVKLYDLAVKTGSYTDRSGAEKGRYLNVGSILQTNDGGKMILLNRAFNPAGVPHKEGSDQIIVSMFKPKEASDGGDAAPAPAPRPAPRPAPGAPAFDDDIPF